MPESVLYCTFEDVERITGVLPEHYQLEDDDVLFKTIIEDWIRQATSVINNYLHREYESDQVPQDVRLVCSLLVSNIIAFGQSRRETPIIRKNDWSVNLLGADLFTDELKDLLDPFVDETEHSSRVGVVAITGEDLWD